MVDRYHTSGSAVQQVGWKVLDVAPPAKAKKGKGRRRGAERRSRCCRRASRRGSRRTWWTWRRCRRRRAPPKRFTEGTLLTAMETAGKTLDEKELSDAMKETGLGTPATRAAIIEVLLKREYIVRNGKSLEATDKGIRLIEVVHPEVKSPAMTGQWEAYLNRIQRGQAQLAPFLEGIEDYVREVVGKVGQMPARAANGDRAVGAVARRRRTPRPSRPPHAAAGRPRRRPRHARDRSRNCCTTRSAFPRSAPTRKPSAARVIEGRRRAAGDAHRRRQIALLPAARASRAAAPRW